MKKRLFIALLFFTLAVVFVLMTYRDELEHIKEEQLVQTQTIATTFVRDYLYALDGSAKDPTRPEYLQIRESMKAIYLREQYAYVYLVGQHSNGDFFFLLDVPTGDFEPAAPGELYEAIPPEFVEVYKTGKPIIVPIEDKWGSWISCVVPVKDHKTGKTIAILGTDINQADWWLLGLKRMVLSVTNTFFILLAFLIIFLAVRGVRQHKKKIDASLQTSEDQLSAIASSTGAATVIVDFSANIIRGNEIMREMFEIGDVDVKTLTVLDLTDEKTKSFEDFEKVVAIVESGGQITFEWESKTLESGTIFPTMVTALPLTYNGAPTILALVIDNTERKKAERERIEMEERLAQVMENTKTTIWEINPEGVATYVSESWLKRQGQKQEDIVGKAHFYDFLDDSFREQTKQRVFDLMKRREPFRNIETRTRKANNELIWVAFSGSPFFDDAGKLLGYRGCSTEITDRKEAEITKTGYWEYDVQTKTYIGSAEFYRLCRLGEAGRIVTLKDILLGLHPDDVPMVEAKWAKTLQEESDYELTCRLLPVEGELQRYIYVRGERRVNERNEAQYRGFLQDITPLKQIEEKLLVSEREFRHAQEIAKLGHWIYRVQNDTYSGSSTTYDIFGLDKSIKEFPMQAVADRIHPEDSEEVFAEFAEAIKEGEVYKKTYRLLPEPGKPQRYVHVTAEPHPRVNGELEYFGFAQEITKQMQVERNLRLSEENLKAAMHVAKLGQWTYDVEEKMFLGSNGAAEIFSAFVADKKIPLDDFFDAVHRDDRLSVADQFFSCISQNIPFEVMHRTPPDSRGREDYIYSFGTLQKDVNGRPVVIGVCQNITSITQTKNELSLAKDIQRSLLPEDFFPSKQEEHYAVNSLLKLASGVGGDFFDILHKDENKLVFVVGDVSGKGMPAALFAASAVVLFRYILAEEHEPHSILQKLNNTLAQNNPTMNFITMFCGVLNLETGELLYTNAGHTPPIILPKQGELRKLPSQDLPPIGSFNDALFKTKSTQLKRGDTLLMYTDGITEAEDVEERLFGEKRLMQFCKDNRDVPPEHFPLRLQLAVEDFAGEAGQYDDITIVEVTYL